MYIDVVPNRKSPPAVLVRESVRENGKHKKRTLANLSKLPTGAIELLRLYFRGEPIRSESLQHSFDILRTQPYGHIAAVLGSLRNCALEPLLSSKRNRNRDLVTAMIVERIINPSSKLATSRHLTGTESSTLSEQLALGDIDENDLYDAMDWLVARQTRIEQRLAQRHLSNASLVLYDATSTWFEGNKCSLAEYGYSRDRKRGKKQLTFGLLCERDGCPVAIEAFKGNTADPTTVATQIHKLRQRFGLEQVVLVGDRGMITSARIREDLQPQGLLWISALRSSSIRALVNNGDLQPSLFDERDLAEITCESQFPGERLIVCHNPILAERRHKKRQQLLYATETALQEIQQATCRDKYRFKGIERISKRVHKALGKHKMAKHFSVDISADSFVWQRNQQKIDEEAALDGFYVIRTNVAAAQLDSAQTVQAYKSLSSVERAFRSFKTVDLKVRPIHHYRGDWVRAHLLLCMLAYYVEFHMRRCLAPMLFDDPDGGAPRSSPVAPARPSQAARHKASSKRTPDGLPVHGFHSLLRELSTVAKQQVKPKIAEVPAFEMMTVPNELQEKAFALLNVRLVARTRDCAH